MSSDSTPTDIRILESALALLETGGASAVRVSDIAKHAGISRQALYLHYPNRADLLIAATRHKDALIDIDARLAPSRAAPDGLSRLDAYIDAWAAYIPEIYGVAKALMAMQDSDKEARAAWSNRMQAMREGCAAAVDALARDSRLTPELTRETATDLLWTWLSVRNWEHLTQDCGWTQADYATQAKRVARKSLLSD